MLFTKRLREPIKRGEITTSVRIWKRPHVKVGNRYVLEEGHIVVDKLHQIDFDDITPSLSRASGFAGVADLLRTAKHGAGENVYLVEFHYEPMPQWRRGCCADPLTRSVHRGAIRRCGDRPR